MNLENHSLFKYIFNEKFQGTRNKFWLIKILSGYEELIDAINLTNNNLFFLLNDKEWAIIIKNLIKDKKIKIKFIKLQKDIKDKDKEIIIKNLKYYLNESSRHIESYYEIIKKNKRLISEIKNLNLIEFWRFRK